MKVVFMGTPDFAVPALERLIKEHDVEAMSVPYIVKGQELGEIRQGDPLTLSVLFYSSIQGFAETLVARDNLKLPEKEWFLAMLRNENRE